MKNIIYIILISVIVSIFAVSCKKKPDRIITALEELCESKKGGIRIKRNDLVRNAIDTLASVSTNCNVTNCCIYDQLMIQATFLYKNHYIVELCLYCNNFSNESHQIARDMSYVIPTKVPEFLLNERCDTLSIYVYSIEDRIDQFFDLPYKDTVRYYVLFPDTVRKRLNFPDDPFAAEALFKEMKKK